MRKKIEEVLPTIQVLCFTSKKFLPKVLPTKQSNAQSKGEKRLSCPRKFPTLLASKKWSVPYRFKNYLRPGFIRSVLPLLNSTSVIYVGYLFFSEDYSRLGSISTAYWRSAGSSPNSGWQSNLFLKAEYFVFQEKVSRTFGSSLHANANYV